MLKRIFLVVAALIAVLIIVIALQDATFEVKRSATIQAPAAVVYDQVADFQKWRAWSPWEGIDTDLQRTYNGSPSGDGAHYEWKGEKTGEGMMTITNSKAPSHLGIDLVFTKPMQQTNRTDFDFAGSGDTTEVTWTMTGKNNFMGKAFSLVANIDKMVGKDFEKGLQNLKKASESAFVEQQKKDAEAAAAAAAVPVPEATVDAGTP